MTCLARLHATPPGKQATTQPTSKRFVSQSVPEVAVQRHRTRVLESCKIIFTPWIQQRRILAFLEGGASYQINSTCSKYWFKSSMIRVSSASVVKRILASRIVSKTLAAKGVAQILGLQKTSRNTSPV